jgi:hypothetical protein
MVRHKFHGIVIIESFGVVPTIKRFGMGEGNEDFFLNKNGNRLGWNRNATTPMDKAHMIPEE